MYKYQVAEPNEDPLKAIIEKSGDVVRFTLQDIRDNLTYGKRSMGEIDATQKIQEAVMANVANTHPEVLTLSEEMLTAVYVYRQAMGVATQCKEKIAQLKESIEIDEQAVQDIAAQTGLALHPEVDTPPPAKRPIPPFDVQSKPVEGEDAN